MAVRSPSLIDSRIRNPAIEATASSLLSLPRPAALSDPQSPSKYECRRRRRVWSDEYGDGEKLSGMRNPSVSTYGQ